jgi:hypothetical protein
MKPELYIDLMSLRSVNQEDMFYQDNGHFIRRYQGSGQIGGVLSNIVTDDEGRIYVQSATISSLLGCGHAVNSVELIAGICMVCGRLCCVMPGCLVVCDVTGRTACRRHYSVRNGIVVSELGKGFFWRFKAKLLARKRKEINHATKKLPEKT